MSNVAIYTSVYRKNAGGRCVRAAVSFRVKVGDEVADIAAESTTRTYGDLWLTKLAHVVNVVIASHTTKRSIIKLVTGQDVTRGMAKKLEQSLVDCLGSGDEPSAERAALAVLKQGRYTPRANDHLYVPIVLALWEACIGANKLGFEHVFNDKSTDTFDLVKKMHSDAGSDCRLVIGSNKRRRLAEARAPL